MNEAAEKLNLENQKSDSAPQAIPPETNTFPYNKKKKYHKIGAIESYKGVILRFVILYKHVIGLIAGWFVAYVRGLPEFQKRGLRSLGKRFWAFIIGLFLRKELRDLPFEVQLRRRLEMLGPTYIKLGQIMAIREDILPTNITTELKMLLDRLPALPYEVIREVVEDSLGNSIHRIFLEFEPTAVGSASIAQTHLATTLKGDRVIVKVIKPGIRETILLDLKLLRILAKFLELIISRYQPKMIIEEFCTYTEKEIDFTYEADHAELFAANFAHYPNIIFPKIYREFTTRDVLVMEYLDGLKPTDPQAKKLDEETIEQLIDMGVGAILKMLYEDGFFHADLHAGNLIILPGPKIGFIDLGMVGRFDEKIKRRMLYYFHALVNEDVEGSAKHLMAIARIGKRGDPQGFRRAVIDLFRRYLVQSHYGQFSLAQLILESLKIGGRYRIFFPVEMTLMVKALVTFEGVGRMLKPNLDVPTLSRKHMQRIFTSRYNPAVLVKQFFHGIPELVDIAVRLPEIISSSSRFWEETITDENPRENPLSGLRSALIAGSCIIAGVIALVQQAPTLVWVILFSLGGIFSLSGRK